jgi:hypothetical protein
MWRRSIVVLALVGHLFFQLKPAYTKVVTDTTGRDFASYYYALQAAKLGQDPYLTQNLNRFSSQGQRKKVVHPFFYPPPYLLAMGWALPLSLSQSYLAMLFLNELCLFGMLFLLIRGFAVSLPMVGLVLVAFTPIPDNAWMGQANLLALLPALLGLYLSRKQEVLGGVLVGIAGMLKMSPAFFLLHFAVMGRWKGVAAGVVTAVLLSVLVLPLVSFEQQLRFYTEILPGFGTGDYNGLKVAITLNANHSWPDLLNRLFPGNDRLSPTAQVLSTLSLLAALGGWSFWGRKQAPRTIQEEGLVFGVLSVFLVMLPVYTYEHHLVALLPMIVLSGSVLKGRLETGLFGLCFFCLAWPLGWLKAAQEAIPVLDPLFRESKFLGELLLIGIGVWQLRRLKCRN